MVTMMTTMIIDDVSHCRNRQYLWRKIFFLYQKIVQFNLPIAHRRMQRSFFSFYSFLFWLFPKIEISLWSIEVQLLLTIEEKRWNGIFSFCAWCGGNVAILICWGEAEMWSMLHWKWSTRQCFDGINTGVCYAVMGERERERLANVTTLFMSFPIDVQLANVKK